MKWIMLVGIVSEFVLGLPQIRQEGNTSNPRNQMKGVLVVRTSSKPTLGSHFFFVTKTEAKV
jgi:hypothetical protein